MADHDEFDDNPDWTEVELSPLDHADMLKVARVGLRLTQKDAAELLRVPLSTIRSWEQHRYEPDDAAKTLIRLLYRHPHSVKKMLSESAA